MVEEAVGGGTQRRDGGSGAIGGLYDDIGATEPCLFPQPLHLGGRLRGAHRGETERGVGHCKHVGIGDGSESVAAALVANRDMYALCSSTSASSGRAQSGMGLSCIPGAFHATGTPAPSASIAGVSQYPVG